MKNGKSNFGFSYQIRLFYFVSRRFNFNNPNLEILEDPKYSLGRFPFLAYTCFQYSCRHSKRSTRLKTKIKLKNVIKKIREIDMLPRVSWCSFVKPQYISVALPDINTDPAQPTPCFIKRSILLFYVKLKFDEFSYLRIVVEFGLRRTERWISTVLIPKFCKSLFQAIE